MDKECWDFRIWDSHRAVATAQTQITPIIFPERPENPEDCCPRRLAIPS